MELSQAVIEGLRRFVRDTSVLVSRSGREEIPVEDERDEEDEDGHPIARSYSLLVGPTRGKARSTRISVAPARQGWERTAELVIERVIGLLADREGHVWVVARGTQRPGESSEREHRIAGIVEVAAPEPGDGGGGTMYALQVLGRLAEAQAERCDRLHDALLQRVEESSEHRERALAHAFQGTLAEKSASARETEALIEQIGPGFLALVPYLGPGLQSWLSGGGLAGETPAAQIADGLRRIAALADSLGAVLRAHPAALSEGEGPALLRAVAPSAAFLAQAAGYVVSVPPTPDETGGDE